MRDDLTGRLASALECYCGGEMWSAAAAVLREPQLAGALARDAKVREIVESVNEGLGDCVDPWRVLYRLSSLYPETPAS